MRVPSEVLSNMTIGTAVSGDGVSHHKLRTGTMDVINDPEGPSRTAHIYTP